MAIKPGMRDLAWMAGGAATLLVAALVVLHFRDAGNPAERVASRARRLERVDRMWGTLALASEAEKSAVLAVTDEESRAFADQARAATATVEQQRVELDQLLQSEGPPSERQLLAEFSRDFDALRRIDEEVLGLAVENSNLKAYALAYGPAADALAELTAALSRLVAAGGGADGDESALRLAFGAEIAALRVQSLLPPHIAEESDPKMDAMEAVLDAQGQEAQRDLDELLALPRFAASPDLQSAVASWARFRELEAQILALSRANTNVRSLGLSLNGKRKALLAAQAALVSLRDAIEQEPVAGVGPEPRFGPR